MLQPTAIRSEHEDRCFLHGRFATAWLVCLVTLTGGCETSRTPDPPAPAPTEAEIATKRFEAIVKEIDRRLPSEQSHHPTVAGGPMVEWKNEVVDELIPPPAEGLAWRGKITVKANWSVTVITVPDADDEGEDPEDGSAAMPDGVLPGGLTAANASEIESALEEMASAQRAQSRQAAPLMQVIDDNESDVYELIFEDGRWRLTTPIDEKTEIGLIFKIALRSQ